MHLILWILNNLIYKLFWFFHAIQHIMLWWFFLILLDSTHILLYTLLQIDWLKNQDETFCLMKIQSHFIRAAFIFCFISSHKKNPVSSHFTKWEFDSVLSYKIKIWFCFISQKKNLISFHKHWFHVLFCSVLTWDQNRTEFSDFIYWFC